MKKIIPLALITAALLFAFPAYATCNSFINLPKNTGGGIIWLYLFLITLFPAVELRGAIPAAILVYKLPVLTSAVLITLANILITPIVFLLWDLFLRIAHRIKFLDRFVNFYLANLQRRSQKTIDKYGFLGLLIFVAIPLPGTGAYSGALVAEIFGMHKGKAFLAVSLGVIVASIIVTLAVMGLIPLRIN
ncbi:MAG: COG2426 family protein [Caldisericaceae bacterium]